MSLISPFVLLNALSIEKKNYTKSRHSLQFNCKVTKKQVSLLYLLLLRIRLRKLIKLQLICHLSATGEQLQWVHPVRPFSEILFLYPSWTSISYLFSPSGSHISSDGWLFTLFFQHRAHSVSIFWLFDIVVTLAGTYPIEFIHTVIKSGQIVTLKPWKIHLTFYIRAIVGWKEKWKRKYRDICEIYEFCGKIKCS